MAKVYKTVTVTKTMELRIGVDEDRLTPEFLEHYSEYFNDADSENDIFDTCAFQYVNCGGNFIEGVGKCDRWDKEAPVHVEELYEDTDVEIQ